MTGTFAADAVLAAVLPVDATRVRIGRVDTSLAETAPADGPAEVDLGRSADELDGAPVGILILDADAGGLDVAAGGRLAVRVRDHLRMRRRSARAGRRLRAAGFSEVTSIAWDRGQVAQLPAPSRPPRSLRPAERLPRRAAIVASRTSGGASPSILEAAAVDAGLGTVMPWPLVRSGTLVVIGDDAVLRVAVGAGRGRLQRAAEALAGLSARFPRPELLPVVLGEGTVGLGRWTTERRLSGRSCPAELASTVTDEVLDVLAALHTAGRTAPTLVTTDAAVVAAALGADPRALALRELADTVVGDLAGLPGALGHGDFWHGNLLLAGDRDHLTGVIDWDAARDGTLPFADVIHLVLAARVPRGSTGWGVAVADELLAERPSSPLVTRHADAIGIPVDRGLHRALVVGYWLDRLSTQVRTYADRIERPRWLAANIDPVLRAWHARSAA
jgi:hypothetical protein